MQKVWMLASRVRAEAAGNRHMVTHRNAAHCRFEDWDPVGDAIWGTLLNDAGQIIVPRATERRPSSREASVIDDVSTHARSTRDEDERAWVPALRYSRAVRARHSRAHDSFRQIGEGLVDDRRDDSEPAGMASWAITSPPVSRIPGEGTATESVYEPALGPRNVSRPLQRPAFPGQRSGMAPQVAGGWP